MHNAALAWYNRSKPTKEPALSTLICIKVMKRRRILLGDRTRMHDRRGCFLMKPSATDKIYPVARMAAIVKCLEDEGVDTVDALKDVHLSQTQLRSPQTRVSLNQMIQCCRNAIRLSLDPFFAYHAGLHFHISTYGMYGFAILCSTDFRQAARFAVQYIQLATATDVRFKEEADYAAWTVDPAPLPSIDSELYKFIVELHFGTIISLSRDVMGQTFVPRELHVTYNSAADTKSSADVFGCPVLFGHTENVLVLDKQWLDGPAELGNEITYREVLRLCDRLLEEMQIKIGIAGRVREVLLTNQAQPTSFNAVARRLKMSARTLKRRLREESTSYRKIVDELRTQLAIKYLRDTEITLEDIASSLGFRDATNFQHAFRRWTKKTPGEFRRASRISRRFVA